MYVVTTGVVSTPLSPIYVVPRRLPQIYVVTTGVVSTPLSPIYVVPRRLPQIYVVTAGVVSTPLSPLYAVPKPSGKFGRFYCGRCEAYPEIPTGQGIKGSNNQVGGFVVN